MNWPNLDVRELWKGWSQGRSGDLVGQVVDLLALHDTWMGFLFLFVVLAALWLGAPPLVAFFVDAVLKTDPPGWLREVCKGGSYFLALIAWSLLVVANGMSDARNRNLTFGIIVAVGLIVAFIVADGSMPLLLILLIAGALQVVVPFYIGDTRKENAKYDMPKFAMFAMMFLGSWLILTMPLQVRTAAAGSDTRGTGLGTGIQVQATVQPSPSPTNVPTAQATSGAPKPTAVPTLCGDGKMKMSPGKELSAETSTGSGSFVTKKTTVQAGTKDKPVPVTVTVMSTGNETITTELKNTADGSVYCRLNGPDGNSWWKVR